MNITLRQLKVFETDGGHHRVTALRTSGQAHKPDRSGPRNVSLQPRAIAAQLAEAKQVMRGDQGHGARSLLLEIGKPRPLGVVRNGRFHLYDFCPEIEALRN